MTTSRERTGLSPDKTPDWFPESLRLAPGEQVAKIQTTSDGEMVKTAGAGVLTREREAYAPLSDERILLSDAKIGIIQAWRDGAGRVVTNFDLDSLRTPIISTVRYVDTLSGNDTTGDGLSWATAWATTTKALASNPERIYCRGAIVANNAVQADFAGDRSVEIIHAGGAGYFINGLIASKRTWVRDGGADKNAQAGAATHIVDAKRGLFLVPAVGADDAEKISFVKATDNTFHKSTDGNLYVRLVRDGVLTTPDTWVGIHYSDISWTTTATADRTVLLDGLNVVGELTVESTVAYRKTLLLRRSQVMRALTSNGLTIRGNVLTVAETSMAHRNFADGFNYHSASGYNPVAIELSCVGNYNGLGNSNSINNGSTLHEYATAVRIYGLYHDNEGPNVHDVNQSASANICCVAHTSVALNAENRSDFAVAASSAGSETATMWLDRCTSFGTAVSLENRAPATSSITYRKCGTDGIAESGTTPV